MNPIGFAINTVIWIFTATINLGPWLMEIFFIYIIGPLLGRERLLAMGRGSTVPVSMLFLGTFWGGIWLAFWGALGAPDLAWWGVVFGVVAGWKAGVHVADGIEQAREVIRLNEADDAAPVKIEEHKVVNQAGRVNLDGFTNSQPPEEDEAASVARQ